MSTLKTASKFFLILLGFLYCASFVAQAQVHTVSASASITTQKLARLKQTYQARQLSVLDVSEIEVEGESRLQITFSIPLNPKQIFAQRVHLVDDEKGLLSGQWHLSANLMELTFSHLPAKRKLTLTIDKELQAVNDKALGDRYQQLVKTRQKDPSISFASPKKLILSPNDKMSLPVIALNIDKVDVNFYRVDGDSIASYLDYWSGANSGIMDSYMANEQLRGTKLVYTGRYNLPIKTDVRQTIRLPLYKIPTLKQPGIYVAVMRKAGSYDDSLAISTFMVSNIGLSAYAYRDSLFVATSSLDSGSAMAKVAVTLLDQNSEVVATGVTDQQGWLILPKLKEKHVSLVVAHLGQQTSIIDLRGAELNLSEFNIDGTHYSAQQVALFGPRDLYRVGESVVINGLLRDAYAEPIDNTPLLLDILSPDGDVKKHIVWKANQGLYQYHYALPKSAQTGLWTARVSLADGQYAYYDFHVEDFMPERMALTLTSISTQPLLGGDEVKFNLAGNYLYGAPADNNEVDYQINIKPLNQIDGFKGFQFGSASDESKGQSLKQDSVSLDQQGKANITLDKDQLNNLSSPMTINLNASLLDAGGRPVNRHLTQQIWPASTLPGIRPLFDKMGIYDFDLDKYKQAYSVDENSQASFEIININRQGQRLATTSPFRVKLIRERYNYYWKWDDDDYRWSLHSDKREFVQSERVVTINANDKAIIKFPVEWGYYRIEVTDPDTGVMSSVRFNAGYNWQNDSQDRESIRPDQVKLTWDKPMYLAGQTAHLNVQSPMGGDGYLLVQSSDGILFKQRITLPKAGKTFAIPVDNRWKRQDIYVVAEVIQHQTLSSQWLPKRAIGILHAPMADKNRHLQVTLKAPAKMLPNTVAHIQIDVKRPDGSIPKYAMVSVSAVDSGVLSLTNYQTPDPYQQLFAQNRYQTGSWDIYDRLISKQGKLAKLGFGGDSDDEDEQSFDIGGKKVLATPLIVAEQLEPVTLDAQGHAVVSLPLPNFNGELRLMAQAWSADTFGAGEQTMKVASPIVAELSVPRFLGGGDQATLALDLRNLSGQSQTFSLQVEASGLVQLSSPVPSSMTLENGQRQIIHIPVFSQLAGLGQGTIKVTLSGVVIEGQKDKQTIQRVVSFPIRPAFPAVTQHYETQLQPNQQWQLPQTTLANAVLPSAQAVTLISHLPRIDLHRYISELYAYPYGCIEQTTSGVFPSLYTNYQELASFGIMTSSDKARRENIQKGIDKIESMQLTNGGFGFWDASSFESYWGSVYATDFLFSAQKQGFNVQQATLDKATNRIRAYLRDPNNSINTIDYYYDSSSTRFAVQTYGAYVLARENRIFVSDVKNIADHLPINATSLELIQLSIAAKLSGDDALSKRLSNLEMLARSSNDKDVWDYGSSVRDSALKLTLMDQYGIMPLEKNSELTQLLKDISYHKWFSTQESNAIFMLGKKLQEKTDKVTWQAELNGQALTGNHAVYRTIQGKQLQNGIQVVNHSDMSIYTSTNINYYPKLAPLKSGNIDVERYYYTLTGQRVDMQNVHEGDLVLVELSIMSNEDIPDALVVDLLPAGFELENQNLQDSSASLDLATDMGQLLVKHSDNKKISHQEFRDDRYVASLALRDGRNVSLVYLARAVTPGQYQLPSPIVQSMYTPENYGIGESKGQLVVLAKPSLPFASSK